MTSEGSRRSQCEQKLLAATQSRRQTAGDREMEVEVVTEEINNDSDRESIRDIRDRGIWDANRFGRTPTRSLEKTSRGE